MGKPNPSFQKRLRERKKQEQRAEKLRIRVERKQNKVDVPEDENVTDLADILGFGAEDETDGEDGEGDEDGEGEDTQR